MMENNTKQKQIIPGDILPLVAIVAGIGVYFLLLICIIKIKEIITLFLL